MSKAKDEYIKLCKDIKKCKAVINVSVSNYVQELEHELSIKNTALNIMVKKEIELKQQKAELIDFVEKLVNHINFAGNEVLNKYDVK